MRTSRLLLVLAALVPGALAAGCSSFSPTLGSTPFFCGTDKPQCPDGYTCMPQGSASVCLAAGATAPDAAGSSCRPDPSPVEPNDMMTDALDTTVETSKPGIDFAGLSICPAGDKDFYLVTMNGTDHLEVTVTDDATGSPLQLLIVGSNGATLAQGSPTAANKLHAYISDPLPAGPNYVEVLAADTSPMGTNTYGLQITTCATPMSANSCTM